MNRQSFISSAHDNTFDICIIGGGITGAGILANAIERGLKTILIEKNDFASGTSSRSSKMIHGGLRYLRYLQVNLVREALMERGHLLQAYPHLVKPLSFILPSFNSELDMLSKHLALIAYDKLAGKAMVHPHRRLSADELIKELPGFKQQGLKGGMLFWDAYTNDARLTCDVLCDAAAQGAVVLNYVEASKFINANNTVKVLVCKDLLSNETIAVKAKVYINATGVWTDEILEKLFGPGVKKMEPTKGVHLLIPSDRLPSEHAIAVVSTSGDKRFLYTLPWENGLTILGSTDTAYHKKPDEPDVTQEDINYILDAFNASFPEAKLTMHDIVSVYSGLRPLLNEQGEKDNYSRSREYQIWWSEQNFINIAGGKLTSFLSMGKHCLDVVHTHFKHLWPEKIKAVAHHNYNGPWKEKYGPNGVFIERIITENSFNKTQISLQWKYTNAEMVFFIRHQFAETLADLLTRRTSITYAMKDFDEQLVENLAALMAKELRKNDQWVAEQKQNYYKHWLQYHPTFLHSTNEAVTTPEFSTAI
jgi:glycerol-3-phosphate dehydrogenase